MHIFPISMRGLKWDFDKDQWQLGTLPHTKWNSREKHLVLSIDDRHSMVFFSSNSDTQDVDCMKLPFPTSLPLYEGTPCAATIKDGGPSGFRSVRHKAIETTKTHLRGFQTFIRKADTSLLDTLLDDKGFATRRSEDLHIEKDSDAPVHTDLVDESDSASSGGEEGVYSGDEEGGRESVGEEEDGGEISDIEDQSNSEEEGADDDVEFEEGDF